MKEGVGPWLPNPIKTYKDVEAIQVPKAEDRLHYVMEAIKMSKKALANEVPLIGFAGSPWTLLCYALQGKGSKTFGKAHSIILSKQNALSLFIPAGFAHAYYCLLYTSPSPRD